MTDKPRQPRYRQVFAANPEMAELACEYWQIAVQHLCDNDLLTDARVRMADRYARACAEYEIIHAKAQEEGPVRVGPNGGDVFNFLWSAAEKLNDRIAKLEDALLISPKAAGGALKEKKPDGPKTAAARYLTAARPN